jgi:CheY-like chemotaxis protein
MKKKILLVDDEQIFHFINTRVIQRTCIDCDIQTALNGRDALGIIGRDIAANSGLPDIIFVDLNMPTMGGFEFIQTFREMQLPNKESITIAILTSSMSNADNDKADSLGIKHFITKPLTEADVSKLFDEN